MQGINFKADILFVAALHEEATWIRSVFGEGQWNDFEKDGVIYKICSYAIDDASLNLALVTQLQVGMNHAAFITTKSICLLEPKLVVMTGICAGVKGKTELGDLIIASKVFDYGSGKVVEGRLRPCYEPVMMDSWLWHLLDSFSRDSDILSSIDLECPVARADDTPLAIHIGSLGCGAAVVACPSIIEEIMEVNRKLLGLDMESYAVALSAQLSTTSTRRTEHIIVKGVVDFADAQKSDNYHGYSAYASASFVKKFIDRHYSSLIVFNTF